VSGVLDRLEAICLEQQEFPCSCRSSGNDLASAVIPLLPLLGDWTVTVSERAALRTAPAGEAT
jgi:hypothetical protein